MPSDVCGQALGKKSWKVICQKYIQWPFLYNGFLENVFL